MDYVTLGSTGYRVNKNGFGALPIQRVGENDAVALLRKAFESGINYFDTARFYTDSEQKIGIAMSGVRDKVVIATKTMPQDVRAYWEQLETSLTMLKTDYIDIYQFHNPAFCPKPGDGSGLYEAMLEAKSQGKIRHIGFTNHRIELAREAVESGLYETLQYPLSYLASDEELALVQLCKEKNAGFIAMKALAGGLITNSAAAYAYLNHFDNVLPIWGVQREAELDEFIAFHDAPPVLNDELRHIIDHDIKELKGGFCRGCGYCLPCPKNIEIPMSARMSQLIRRAPENIYLGGEWQEKMKLIEECINCGHCKSHCPYGLDTPQLLRDNLADYLTFNN